VTLGYGRDCGRPRRSTARGSHFPRGRAAGPAGRGRRTTSVVRTTQELPHARADPTPPWITASRPPLTSRPGDPPISYPWSNPTSRMPESSCSSSWGAWISQAGIGIPFPVMPAMSRLGAQGSGKLISLSQITIPGLVLLLTPLGGVGRLSSRSWPMRRRSRSSWAGKVTGS
jgi:hypothetical protein